MAATICANRPLAVTRSSKPCREVRGRAAPVVNAVKPSGPHHAHRCDRRSILHLGWLSTFTLGTASASASEVLQRPTISGLLDEFRIFDTNADGVLDVEELAAAFKGLGLPDPPTKAEIYSKIVPILDFNDNQKVETEEFLRGMALNSPIDEAFWEVVDADNNGTVNLPELRQALGDIGGEVGDAIIRVSFKNADRNKDGKLDPAECGTAMDWITTAVLGDTIGE